MIRAGTRFILCTLLVAMIGSWQEPQLIHSNSHTSRFSAYWYPTRDVQLPPQLQSSYPIRVPCSIGDLA